MTKHDVVSRHGSIRTLFLEVVAFLGTFSERGFGEVDMINVSTCDSLSGRIRNGRDGNEQKQHEKQRASAFHSFLHILLIGFGDASAGPENGSDYNTCARFC